MNRSTDSDSELTDIEELEKTIANEHENPVAEKMDTDKHEKGTRLKKVGAQECQRNELEKAYKRN